jgi:hypothetical protein
VFFDFYFAGAGKADHSNQGNITSDISLLLSYISHLSPSCISYTAEEGAEQGGQGAAQEAEDTGGQGQSR